MCLQIMCVCVCVCVYKKDLVLNKLQWLICHEIQTNEVVHDNNYISIQGRLVGWFYDVSTLVGLFKTRVF